MNLSDFPLKLYYSIGEVSQIVGVEPHVLRYWETEFKTVSPSKGDSGRRQYRRKDVEKIIHIRHLLYERKFTIAGAKKHIAETKGSNMELFDMPQTQAPAARVQAAQPAPETPQLPVAIIDSKGLKEINSALKEIRNQIKHFRTACDEAGDEL